MLLLTRDTICFLRQSAQVMVRRRGQGTITLLPVHHHCRPLPRAGVGRLLTCNNRNQKLMLPSHYVIWSHHTILPDWERFQIWIQMSLTACVQGSSSRKCRQLWEEELPPLQLKWGDCVPALTGAGYCRHVWMDTHNPESQKQHKPSLSSVPSCQKFCNSSVFITYCDMYL